MKQKKSIIIVLVSVVAVCLLGFVAAKVFNWPVDINNTSGNVAKSSRFSRKTTTEDSNNMKELLLNDEDYKNGIVAAYLVMKTRAQQFDALVDMSNEVAGNIKEFASVLKDMKAAQPMIANVCETMEKAGQDLNSALGGEEAKNLAQNTTNAALAYTTLQKQNGLATRFIDTADAYLAGNAGEDRLKFVRDQWVEYQQLTAILEKDEKAAAEMEDKGHLLNVDQSLAALASFPAEIQIVSMVSGALCAAVGGVGNIGIAAQTGNLGIAAQTGNLGEAAQTGSLGIAAQTGNLGEAAQTGSLGVAAQTGNLGEAAQTGSLGVAAQTGNLGEAAQTGSLGIAAQTGNLGIAAQTGNLGIAAQTGNLGMVFGALVGNFPNVGNVVQTGALFNTDGQVGSLNSSAIIRNTVTSVIENAATGDVTGPLGNTIR